MPGPEGEQCQDCYYCQFRKGGQYNGLAGQRYKNVDQYECKRYQNMVIKKSDDWCGDFVMKTAKEINSDLLEED